jgi:hypothetical protein
MQLEVCYAQYLYPKMMWVGPPRLTCVNSVVAGECCAVSSSHADVLMHSTMIGPAGRRCHWICVQPCCVHVLRMMP